MPLLFADASDLHATARRIRDHSDDLRRRAALLARSADEVAWRSPAAAAFRHRAAGLTGRMRTAAHHLDRSAERLDEHARRVGHALAAVEHAAVRAVEVFVR